jgi:hypothetical protein
MDSQKPPKWISLNVGGKVFTTTLCTLNKEPNSMLARMFSQEDERMIYRSDTVRPKIEHKPFNQIYT